MKLKYIVVCVLAIAFLGSCKSKKKVVTYHPKPKKEIVVVEEKTVPTEVQEEAVKTVITRSTEEYIEQYKDISMQEMRTYKIPASITLAQGILESSSGQSALTLRSNNHFGIKCHVGWTGEYTHHDDDEKGECFRVYKDPKTSFEDHSKFLTTRSRYASLFELDPGDYVGWAEGLSKAGYATDRRYPAKLIGLIEKYGLDKYDKEVLGSEYKKVVYTKREEHLVVKGDTLYAISKKYGLTVDELKKINGLNTNEISIGQILYLK
jgi:flagellum-specific peptidoglycan hydrolase FlgJ